MDFFSRYKSPLGYFIGDNNIDSYGVDHSGFSVKDEVEYQQIREQRENQLIKNYNASGITTAYPQFGKNFWGQPENNYGFGMSEISSNIGNIEQTPLPANSQQTVKKLQPNQTYTPPSHIGEIVTEGIKGFGQGVVTGLESLANGATFGGYNWADEKLGLGASERRQELQQYANDAGVGTAFDWANRGTEFAGNALAGYGIASSVNPWVQNGYNAYNIYRGGRNLERQLRRGNNFEDIYMGRMSQNKLDEINNLRQQLGEPIISSRKVRIPENNVNHIWQGRVNVGKGDPRDVTNCLKRSVFSDDSQIFPGNVSRHQVMIKTGDKYPYMSVITRDEISDSVAVKTTMKKNLQNASNIFQGLKY